jgi:hypothetical protein
MKVVHFNYNPKTNLPACQIGAIGQARDFSEWRVDRDINKVTCKMCLKALGKKRNKKKNVPTF